VELHQEAENKLMKLTKEGGLKPNMFNYQFTREEISEIIQEHKTQREIGKNSGEKNTSPPRDE
jgi:hypothetical protein